MYNKTTRLVEISYFFIQQCIKSPLVIKSALNCIIFSIKTFIRAYFTIFVKIGGESVNDLSRAVNK